MEALQNKETFKFRILEVQAPDIFKFEIVEGKYKSFIFETFNIAMEHISGDELPIIKSVNYEILYVPDRIMPKTLRCNEERTAKVLYEVNEFDRLVYEITDTYIMLLYRGNIIDNGSRDIHNFQPDKE